MLEITIKTHIHTHIVKRKKTVFDGLISILDMAEGRIFELDIPIDSLKTEKQKSKD